MLLPHLADMADLAGLDAMPDGLWSNWSDPRVDAIVPLAGDAYFFGRAGLAEIEVPVLAMGGTADSDTPFMWDRSLLMNLLPTLEKRRWP